jgi:ankyrin repeat protein
MHVTPAKNKPKDTLIRKNPNSNNITTPSNMRIQTLPDTMGLDLDPAIKGIILQQKKNGGPEKKTLRSSKESEDPCLTDNSQSLQDSKVNKHLSDLANRNENKEDPKKTQERDLSSHSAKSNYSVNLMRKPNVKNQNGNEKTANYTIHISKEKSKENEGLTLNDRFLNLVKLGDYEKCLDLVEKNKVNKLLNVNYRGENDWTAIHYSALNGNHKILNLLLYNDAIIDNETSSKLTPLMIACQKY